MIHKTSATILFYYKVTDLWDKVQQHTGMVAKFQPEPEKVAVTSDDSDFFHREITKGITKAYELCHKLSTNLSKSLLYNENFNIVATGAETNDDPPETDAIPVLVSVYGFYVKNILGHYDHALYVIDSYIEKLTIDYFLQAWWLKCGLVDFWKASTGDISLHILDLNNAMYALYKPTITLTPAWQAQDVSVDLETGEETDNTTDTTTTVTTSEDEVEYYDTLAEFPATGDEDIIYVDRSTNLMYSWNGTAYEVYSGETGEYEVNYYDTDSLVVIHNLGKMSPHIEGTDGDGETFDVIWTPIDVNSGTASWNTSGSGVLRFN